MLIRVTRTTQLHDNTNEDELFNTYPSMEQLLRFMPPRLRPPHENTSYRFEVLEYSQATGKTNWKAIEDPRPIRTNGSVRG